MEKRCFKKGFTIIEMMIAVVIFSIIIVAIMGIFTSLFKNQKYTLNFNSLLNQTNYTSEYMSKMIRMARKDSNTGKSFTFSPDWIEFLNYRNEPVRFFLDDNEIKIDVNGDEYSLTSNENIKVTGMKFEVKGDESGKQPFATFLIEAEGLGGPPVPKIRIQTSISQRDLNI